MEGPDHKASLEPNELKQMIISIRNVEKAIYRDIIYSSAIVIKRPGTGIAPEFGGLLFNKVAKVDIKKDSPFFWDYF